MDADRPTPPDVSVHLIVTYKNGQTYSRRAGISYTGNIPDPAPGHELREIEYQVERAWGAIRRDIQIHEHARRITSPFAWS